MGHIFFTAPRQQDRCAGQGRSDSDCLLDEIHLGPSAEAATHQSGVHLDVTDFQPGDFRRFGQDLGRQLVARPNLDPAIMSLPSSARVNFPLNNSSDFGL